MSKLPLREIKRVEFGVLSPDEVRSLSIGEITCPESAGAGREPLPDSLSDPRLGATETHRCATCNHSIQDCPGHFGHIELARPVYHVYYIQTIKKVLECICLRCAHIRVTYGDKLYRRLRATTSLKKRFKLIWKYAKNKRACENDACGVLHPQVRLQRHEIITSKARRNSNANEDSGSTSKKVLSTTAVYDILSRIPDAECWLLGFNPQKARPEWMILTVLPVPPPCVRPSVSMGSSSSGTGSSGIDDLTFMLTSILRHSNSIKNTENDPTSHSLEDYENLLIQFVSTYFDNETNLFSKASLNVGRQIKSLKTRLTGKTGRIRGYLEGKRVNFTARTVITGDPNLSIDELGVPYEIAMNLTFPERVTSFNIDRLQAMVDNGPKKYPGAAYWERELENGSVKRRDLLFGTERVTLQIGDVVKRHLVNGDLVLFNRQPTLHRPSMMAHTVRVMRGKTFKMNLAVTTPYNADFDGDEMNLHIAQGWEAQAEAKVLSRVSHMVMSPQANKPVMGIVQDALCAVRKFTLRDTLFDRAQVYNLLMRIPRWNGKVPTPCIVKPQALWSGKQLMSLLLPSYLHYRGKHPYPTNAPGGTMCPYDTTVYIEHGELLSGIICKKSVGSSAGGLIDIIWREGGADAVRDFFDGCQYLVNEYMHHHGFSVGLGDCIISDATQAEIDARVTEACTAVDNLIKEAGKGGSLSKNDARTLEFQITRTLAKARDVSGTLAAESLPYDNNFKQMVQAGSKGSMINVSQISAVVGQQNVDGGRITFTMCDRALPYFAKGDVRPAAKGFVEHSYLKGLTPTEFFFHAMGGREGLIDTACRTSETGYLQRKLVKALEDYSIAYDATVRSSSGTILQFAYGEDGIDGVHIEKQHVELVRMTDAQVRTLSNIPDEVEQLFKDRAYLRTHLPKMDNAFHAPLNFKRLLKRFSDEQHSKNDCGKPCTAAWARRKVQEFLAKLTSSFPLFDVLVRYFFASNAVVKTYGLSQTTLDACLKELEKRFLRAKVEAGEAVGIVAAQSIGEPTTQLTLNSVEWNTPMLFLVDNKLRSVDMGEFVDNFLDKLLIDEDKENHPNQTELGWIKDRDVQVWSVDEHGKCSWKKVEAVTRHPVVNKDGTDTILKVTLRSGRSVTATKGKSFLTRRDNKLLHTEGADIRVGDFLPVSKHWSLPPQALVTHLNLEDYLAKNKFVFVSEIEKALPYQAKYTRFWYKKYNGVAFTLPFSRSDSCTWSIRNHLDTMWKRGHVYPLNPGKKGKVGQIPVLFPLDHEFGWFCGAYLAEGGCTEFHTIISNLDTKFNDRVIAFVERYNIGWHYEKDKSRNHRIKGVRIHSVLLTELITTLFGTGSAQKRIPDVFMGAPDDFLKGLIAGYFDGDGTFARGKVVTATSISHQLLLDLQVILSRFGIHASVQPMSDFSYNNLKKKFSKAFLPFRITLNRTNSIKFAATFDLTIWYKNDHCKNMSKSTWNNLMLPNLVLSTGTVTMKANTAIKLYKARKMSTEDFKIAEACMNEDVFYDEIVSIEEVKSKWDRVYDLTVAETRNFVVRNCINMADSFHASGDVNQLVTSGVGRIKELVNDLKQFKSPSMIISLLPSHQSQVKAKQFADALLPVFLHNLVTNFTIQEGVLEQDNVWVELAKSLSFAIQRPVFELSSWSLRMVISREQLFRVGLCMAQVGQLIEDACDHDVWCFTTVDNAPELVLYLFYEDDPQKDNKDNNKDAIDPCEFLKEMSTSLLEYLCLRGIPEIEVSQVKTRDTAVVNPDTGGVEDATEFYVETIGINMPAVVVLEGVDRRRLYCNDPKDMYQYYGIEAARACLLKEIRLVIEGSYVNYRHLAMLCDTMTSRGQLLSVGRHGLNRISGGPLKRSTFEESVDQLLQSSIQCEVDDITGVSERVMVGRHIPTGSGVCSVFWDEGKFEETFAKTSQEGVCTR